jgi:hypothetical protein
MNITIDLNTDNLVRGNSKQELITFIVDIDKKVQDVDFSIKLINALISSLEEDEDLSWIAQELGFKEI